MDVVGRNKLAERDLRSVFYILLESGPIDSWLDVPSPESRKGLKMIGI